MQRSLYISTHEPMLPGIAYRAIFMTINGMTKMIQQFGFEISREWLRAQIQLIETQMPHNNSLTKKPTVIRVYTKDLLIEWLNEERQLTLEDALKKLYGVIQQMLMEFQQPLTREVGELREKICK